VKWLSGKDARPQYKEKSAYQELNGLPLPVVPIKKTTDRVDKIQKVVNK
jgi:hypothetical protein